MLEESQQIHDHFYNIEIFCAADGLTPAQHVRSPKALPTPSVDLARNRTGLSTSNQTSGSQVITLNHGNSITQAACRLVLKGHALGPTTQVAFDDDVTVDEGLTHASLNCTTTPPESLLPVGVNSTWILPTHSRSFQVGFWCCCCCSILPRGINGRGTSLVKGFNQTDSYGLFELQRGSVAEPVAEVACVSAVSRSDAVQLISSCSMSRLNLLTALHRHHVIASSLCRSTSVLILLGFLDSKHNLYRPIPKSCCCCLCYCCRV